MLDLSILESRILLIALARPGSSPIPLPKVWGHKGFDYIHSLQKKGFLSRTYPVLTHLGQSVAEALRKEE